MQCVSLGPIDGSSGLYTGRYMAYCVIITDCIENDSVHADVSRQIQVTGFRTPTLENGKMLYRQTRYSDINN